MSDEYFSAESDPGAAGGGAAPVWELSGWWRRAGATLIDGMLIWIPVSIFTSIVGIGGETKASDGSISGQLDGTGWLISLVALSVYYMTTMPAWNGQTVGKRVTGIRVVREDGLPIEAGFALKRQTLVIGILFDTVGAVLLFIPMILNYLWPLWDEKNQALHDKIVKSRVVRAYAVNDVGTFQTVQQATSPVAPFPVGTVPAAPVVEAPAEPASQAPPAVPSPPLPSAPPPPPPPGGVSTPYTPPPEFENPVPDDD